MRDFNHTLSVLVKAYFEGTLQHGNCHACAVGNIVAESNKFKFTGKQLGFFGRIIWDDALSMGQKPMWQELFVTSTKGSQIINHDNYDGEVKEQIDATGYSWRELARVESAFESAHDEEGDQDECMFNGLMNVVEELAKIHNIDLETTEKAKALFVKH